MTNRSAALAILTVAAVAAGSGIAYAQSSSGIYAGGQITGLFSTGFDSSGNLITTLGGGADGGNDGHYSLTQVAPGDPTTYPNQGTPSTGPAVVDPTTNNSSFPYPFYDSAQYPHPSEWDLPENSGSLTGGASTATPTDPYGYYIFTTTFDVTTAAAAQNAIIQFQAEVDNELTGIVLNGTVIDGTNNMSNPGSPGSNPSVGGASLGSGGFSSVITLKGGFQQGSNTLQFIVDNDFPAGGSGGFGDPVALRLQIDGANAPEPGSLALLAVGVAPVMGLVRRRRARRA